MAESSSSSSNFDSRQLKNLKIIIENKEEAVSEDEERMDGIEIDFAAPVVDDEEEKSVAAADGDNDVQVKKSATIAPDDEEEGPEFHVTLDKIPPGLQNTILNEKIYINENFKQSADDLDNDTASEMIPLEKIKELIDSLGLDESSFDDSTSGSSLFRRDGLHLFGVDELSTKHIFAFFAAYNPYALEWINDSSCNLLWRSENQVLKCIAETTEAYDPDQNSSRRILSRPPKSFKWRVSKRAPRQANHIFVRFIRTQTDRKRKGAEQKSFYYVKYGNPNYGNLRGLISDSKRRQMKLNHLAMINTDMALNSSLGNDDEGLLPAPGEEGMKQEASAGPEQRKPVAYTFRLEDSEVPEEFGVLPSKNSTVSRSKPNGFSLRSSEDLRHRPTQKKMQMYSDELGSDLSKDLRRRIRGFHRGDQEEENEEEEEEEEERRPLRKDSNANRSRVENIKSRLSGLRGPVAPARNYGNREENADEDDDDDYDVHGRRERPPRRKRSYSRSRSRSSSPPLIRKSEVHARIERTVDNSPSGVKSIVKRIAPADLRNRLSRTTNADRRDRGGRF